MGRGAKEPLPPNLLLPAGDLPTFVFELGKLSELPRATVVVEDRYSALLAFKYGAAGFMPDLLARVQVRNPEIPIFFADTRPLAEDWTYRYLSAALAELR